MPSSKKVQLVQNLDEAGTMEVHRQQNTHTDAAAVGTVGNATIGSHAPDAIANNISQRSSSSRQDDETDRNVNPEMDSMLRLDADSPVAGTTHQPAQAITNSTTSASLAGSGTPSLTRVDGKGLWRSWKRNFNRKALALLDLIDNSLDASIAGDELGGSNSVPSHALITSSGENDGKDEFVGRVHIYSDQLSKALPDIASSSAASARATTPVPDEPTPEEVESATGHNTRHAARRASASRSAAAQPRDPSDNLPDCTGLIIVNNSRQPVRPLARVLEVFNSSKIETAVDRDNGMDHVGDIGENGVGLKQGCATMSDRSFVLVRNGEERFVELGIVAESLQSAAGCYLPAYRFYLQQDDDELSREENLDAQMSKLESDLMSFFSQPELAGIAACIVQYDKAPTDSSFSPLRELRLGNGIKRLVHHFKSISTFHGSEHVFMLILDEISYGSGLNSNRGLAEKDERKKDWLTVGKAVGDAIHELKKIIPRTYLHVPKSCDFRVGRERIRFNYWPQRLVEMSSFQVEISQSVPWNAEKWSMEPPWEYRDGSYGMRVYVGFDRVRNHTDQRACNMYVYSRQSGRLIKCDKDARGKLGMTASGTDYTYGLTVIVDDVEGKLPLNPTKQDIAFGERDHGDVHEDNLNIWAGSVTKMFYQYHLKKYANKHELSNKIKEFGKDQIESTVKAIDESKFTTYTYTPATYQKRSIQIRLGTVEEHRGPDTKMVLIRSNAPRKKQKLSHAMPAISHQQYEPVYRDEMAARATYASQAASQYSTTASHQSHFYHGHHPQAVNQQLQAQRRGFDPVLRSSASGGGVVNLADTDDDSKPPAAETTSSGDEEEDTVDYKDLCKKLTDKVVQQNEQLKRVKKENKRMKREIQTLEKRLEVQRVTTSRDLND
ncbi:hypothetical protein THAOC_34414 [Thalassiosira oceanica]|uniref:Uncharacterized protein n=1 Tax=Thalassiosira oceanica TaxID=159749 RepID=K0R3J2_THAOC|nr:hypothetical protein THAOC_34414 [Thalassiosira oceanica]|eukprot:EJK46900.1 hypothetical protein THAOC_34414 [Thalassiosira oceanica]